jgi:hypothetical protein
MVIVGKWHVGMLDKGFTVREKQFRSKLKKYTSLINPVTVGP